MKNKSTIAEVINQYDARSEKVCSIGNSCNQKIESNPSPMGRLKRRYGEWEKMTSRPFILGVIKDGYKLPFKVIPQPVELKNNKSARDKTQFVYEEVQKLLSNGCIQEVESRPAVVNPLTVATNKSGKKRLDCRHLNDCLAKFKFKYEDATVARQLFDRDTHLFSWDLRSAYHHISVFSAHRQYLGFQLKEGQVSKCYVFCALPFGLSTSGYVFSKVLRVLVQFWRASGHLVVMFLDDGIGGHKSLHRAIESSSHIRSSLVNLGFLIAEEKCVWVPSLQAIWLGYFWDMLVGKIYITKERIKKLEFSLDSVLSVIANSKMPLVKVRFIACIIGQIILMQTVLGKVVQLRTRELYKSIMSRASWNAPIMLAIEAVRELEYWRANVSSMNSLGQYVSPNLDSEILIYSDASGDGYGGYASYFDAVDASVLVGSSYSSQLHGMNGLNDSCDIGMELSHGHLESDDKGYSYSFGEQADSGTSSKVNLAPGRAVILESGKDARVLRSF